MGPRDAPNNMSHRIPVCCFADKARVFALDKPRRADSVSRSIGQTRVAPYSIIMIAEMTLHTCCGIPMSAADTFSNTVKSTIHIAVERTMMIGLYHFCVPSDPPKMTGNTGRAHGANTLSIPANSATKNNDMEIKKRVNEMLS
jgi:hypothetical protein